METKTLIRLRADHSGKRLAGQRVPTIRHLQFSKEPEYLVLNTALITLQYLTRGS